MINFVDQQGNRVLINLDLAIKIRELVSHTRIDFWLSDENGGEPVTESVLFKGPRELDSAFQRLLKHWGLRDDHWNETRSK